jgi:transposase
MEILDKDIVNLYILPHLSRGSRGKRMPDSVLFSIVSAILYRLKTGCQWRSLPVDIFFKEDPMTWKGVYHHFTKWTKKGSWEQAWHSLLATHPRFLDLSCVHLDGSHTPAKRGGEAVSYQGRKSCKTSNSLYLCDNQGQMLACSSPVAGEHHDLYDITTQFAEIVTMLSEAQIPVDGLFLNADAGFDSVRMRQLCSEYEIEANIPINPRNNNETEQNAPFDELLYKERTRIERANAWQDSFKALIIRYETKAIYWKNWIVISFIVLFIRKIVKRLKL